MCIQCSTQLYTDLVGALSCDGAVHVRSHADSFDFRPNLLSDARLILSIHCHSQQTTINDCQLLKASGWVLTAHDVVAWLIGDTLVSINVVTIRRAQAR